MIEKQRIIELIDDDFLNTLSEVVSLYGWTGDYIEVSDFVATLHKYKNKEYTPLEIHETEEEETSLEILESNDMDFLNNFGSDIY